MSLFTVFAGSLMLVLSAAFWSCLIMASQSELRWQECREEWRRGRAGR